MEENTIKKLTKKARNYYLLALFAEKKEMYAEAVTNYFKAFFALADLELYKQTEKIPKNHSDRFLLLKEHNKEMYTGLDNIFFVYRETYTQEITKARAEFIRRKVDDIFNITDTEKPTEKDI